MPKINREKCFNCRKGVDPNDKKYFLKFPCVYASCAESFGTTNCDVVKDFLCPKCFAKARNNGRKQSGDGKWNFEKLVNEVRVPETVTTGSLPVIFEETETPDPISSESSEAFEGFSSYSSAPNSLSTVESSTNTQNESQTSDLSIAVSISSRFTVEAVREGKAPFTLPGIQSVSYSECKCCVCGARNGRHRMKYSAIIDAWVKIKVQIPAQNRCCQSHIQDNGNLTTDALELLKIKAKVGSASIYGNELAKWIMALTSRLNNPKKILDFSVTSELPDTEYQLLLGLSKLYFSELMDLVEKKLYNSKNRSSRDAVAMLLMTLRLNISQRVVGFLFGIPNQCIISEAITSAINVLMQHFVPHYLGFQHLSREQIMNTHMRPFYTTILEVDEEDLILICDGTYIYIQKPSDFHTQRKLYSLHKHRNLLKIMMVVLPSGYILAAEGLYRADNSNNDASILREMLRKDNNLLSVLQTRDVLLLNRGFRDVLDDIEDVGVRHFMPCLLPKKRKQFTTREANENRRVTMLRNVVERANGRIKNKFKFLDAVIPCTYIPKIGSFFKIACALINAFSPPLFTQKAYHDNIAQDVQKKLKKPNKMQKTVEEMKLHLGGRATWEEADEDSVLDFPLLTLEELRDITEEPYQIEIGQLYNEQHLMNGTGYKFFYYKQKNGLLRVKMKSRFCRSQKHFVWVWYKPNGRGSKAIDGYFCMCKNGSRSLGCCGHVAAVIRYLGCDKYEQVRPRRNFLSCFLDAAKDAALEDGEATDGNSDVEDIDIVSGDSSEVDSDDSVDEH